MRGSNSMGKVQVLREVKCDKHGTKHHCCKFTGQTMILRYWLCVMPGNCARRLYCGMSSNLWKPKSWRLSSPLTREYSLCLQFQAHLSELDLYDLEYLPSCLSCKCAQRMGLLSHRRCHPRTTAIPESAHVIKATTCTFLVDKGHLVSADRHV
mgnify:CR=1 FL=1